jgi:hypothetical protein
MRDCNAGMAKIVGKNIVIKIPISVLKEEYIIPDELLDDYFRPTVKITNLKEFVEDFIAELNREEENGETPIHRLLDKAFTDAIDNGSIGSEEVPEKDRRLVPGL